MSDLRNLLDREAGRISARPDAFDDVIRRTERRHRTRQVVAGATALAVVAGVALGAWSLLGNQPRRETPGQTPSASSWPEDAWPHETRPEAEAAQEEAASNPELRWQTSMEQVAERYFREVHSWTQVEFDDSLDGENGTDSMIIYAASCDIHAEDGCEGVGVKNGGDQEALVTLERLVRSGPGGVWTVTGVVGPSNPMVSSMFGLGRVILLPGRPGNLEGAVFECPNGDLTRASEAATEEALEALLTASNGATPDPRAAWDLIEPAARPLLGPYEIFAHHMQTLRAEPYDWWSVDAVDADDVQDTVGLEARCPGITPYLSEVYVTFPGDPLQAMPAQFVFVGHPEGPRLWAVVS